MIAPGKYTIIWIYWKLHYIDACPLYELYGLNIYQKLPDLLKWLELDAISKSNDLEQEHYKIAAELSRKIQEQIKQSPDSFKAIELKAFQGINYIISTMENCT